MLHIPVPCQQTSLSLLQLHHRKVTYWPPGAAIPWMRHSIMTKPTSPNSAPKCQWFRYAVACSRGEPLYLRRSFAERRRIRDAMPRVWSTPSYCPPPSSCTIGIKPSADTNSQGISNASTSSYFKSQIWQIRKSSPFSARQEIRAGASSAQFSPILSYHRLSKSAASPGTLQSQMRRSWPHMELS